MNEFEIPWATPEKTYVGPHPSPKQLRLSDHKLKDFFCCCLSNLFFKSPSWKLHITGCNKVSGYLFRISVIIPSLWENHNLWFCFWFLRGWISLNTEPCSPKFISIQVPQQAPLTLVLMVYLSNMGESVFYCLSPVRAIRFFNNMSKNSHSSKVKEHDTFN